MSLRSISTSTWSDPWFEELEPLPKLIFIYLITNEKTNMLGIYEATAKKISNDTDIDRNTVSEILKNFEEVGKIRYENTYLILTNFLKHQKMNTNMRKSAMKTYQCLPLPMQVVSLQLDYRTPQNKKESIESDWKTLLKHFGMIRNHSNDGDKNEANESLSNHSLTISDGVDTKSIANNNNDFLDKTETVPKIEIEVEVEVEVESEIEGEIEVEGLSSKKSITPILEIQTFESLTAQHYASQRKRINQLDRAAIVEIGKTLEVKLPKSSHQVKKNKLIDLTARLAKHHFWKEKRHSLPYLDKNFEEAWNIAYPNQSASPASSGINYAQYEK